jgi:hypothetical protein
MSEDDLMNMTPGQRIKFHLGEIQKLVDHALSMERRPQGMTAEQAVDQIDADASKIACYAAMISAQLGGVPIFVVMGTWAAAIMEIETGITMREGTDMSEILARFDGPIN